MVGNVYKKELHQSRRERELLANDFTPSFSPGAGFTAGFESASNLTQALGSGIRYLNRKSGPQLSPEQVKEKHGLDVEESVSESYAEYLASERDNQEKQDFILSNIDPNQRGSTAFPLLGGLTKGLLDPVGLVAGGGTLKAASALGRMAFGAKALTAAKQASILRSLKVGAAEGVLESIYSTPALLWEQREIQGREYSPQEVVMDIAANVVGNSLFNVAGKALGRMTGRYGTKASREIFDNNMNQAVNGVVPNSKFQEAALAKDTFVLREGDAPIDYKPLPTGTKRLYAVSKTGAIDPKSVRTFDDTYGDTIMLTDTPQYAKNTANSDLVKDPANMIEIDLEEANLLNLDEVLPDDIRLEIDTYLQNKGIEKDALSDLLGDPETLPSGVVQLKALQALEGEGVDLNEINQIIQSKGFDGYHNVSGHAKEGVITKGTEHNVVNLFAPDKVKVRNSYKGVPDPRRAPDVSEEFEAQRAYDTDPRNKVGADIETIDLMEGISKDPIDETEVLSAVEQTMRDAAERVKTIETLDIDPRIKKDIMADLEVKVNKENINDILAASDACVGLTYG